MPGPGQFANPILAGMYPDPTITRVGRDFYLANSTFAWYPGVPLFHSTDLLHWEELPPVLSRPSQLQTDCMQVSRGVFAPSLREHNGTFYMINTAVDGIGNFYVTTTDPKAPWSDPVRLPEIDGIDPSFFFDTDGRAYIVHNGPPPDNKPLYDGHRTVKLFPFDLALGKVSGPGRILVNGGVDIAKHPAWIEGPHLFHRGDYYYLIAAEGGTSISHSEVVFRSHTLDGDFVPYEHNPILTQRDLPANRPEPIADTGHADFVDDGRGNWWAVFLGVEPYPSEDHRARLNRSADGSCCPVTMMVFSGLVAWSFAIASHALGRIGALNDAPLFSEQRNSLLRFVSSKMLHGVPP